MARDTLLDNIDELQKKRKKRLKSNTPVGLDVGLRFDFLGTERRKR